MQEGQSSLSKAPALQKWHIILALLGAGILGFVGGHLLSNPDGQTVSVRAEGETEWMYQDTHSESNPLDPERFGTPKDPKGLEILPLTNRVISRDGTTYTGLKDGQIFSLDRTMVTGNVHFSGTDRTPLDSIDSKDSAEAEATFTGPDGAEFRVILRKLAPPSIELQTFGGVAINQPVHATTGFGTDKLYTEYAYILIQGFADVYRNGELIVKDNYLWVAASRRAQSISNDIKKAGLYNPEQPMADMIIHLVLLPHQLLPDGSYAHEPIPTGVIGLDGKEQGFFHINYRKNITMEGSRFFDKLPASTGTGAHAH